MLQMEKNIGGFLLGDDMGSEDYQNTGWSLTSSPKLMHPFGLPDPDRRTLDRRDPVACSYSHPCRVGGNNAAHSVTRICGRYA